MRLGTRWAAGAAPPAALPGPVVTAVRDVEASLGEDPRLSWTLTYLEGRPVVELDDGTRIRYRADEDRALVTLADDEAGDQSED